MEPCTSVVILNTSIGYRRGAPKDGSYTRTNLLVAFAESIERDTLSVASPEPKLTVMVSPPTDERLNSIDKSIGTRPRRGIRDTRAHAAHSADTLER
jgi:hypothetical protein